MSVQNTRAAVTQAKFNESATAILGLDMLVAGVAGYVHFQSGAAAIGTGLGFAALLMMPVVGIIASAAMSALYGWVAWGLFHHGGAEEATAVVVGVVAGMIALGAHLAGLQSNRDLFLK